MNWPPRPSSLKTSLNTWCLSSRRQRVPQHIYRAFASILSGEGLGALTWDWRGLGESRPIHLRGFEATILAFSFEDDALAPRAAVDALHAHYRTAEVVRRHVRPQEIGVDHIGHFGFFRQDVVPDLWDETVRWLIGLSASVVRADTSRP